MASARRGRREWHSELVNQWPYHELDFDQYVPNKREKESKMRGHADFRTHLDANGAYIPDLESDGRESLSRAAKTASNADFCAY